MLKIVNICVTNQTKDKYLFLKRKKFPFKDYWGMFGGKIEPDEDDKTASERELFEESGIRSQGRFLGKCHEKMIENGEVILETEISFFHFTVDETIKFNPNGNEGEVKWIGIEEFKNNKLIPSDPYMIDSFFIKGLKETTSIIEKNGEEYFQKKFDEIKLNQNIKKPGVGVGVILFKDGKILLGKRHSDNNISKSVLGGEGTWTMPGGKLEYQESFEECGKREVLEECGIIVNDLNVICINNDKNEKAHFVTIGLLSLDFSGEAKVMEPDKIIEWKWFTLEDLPERLYFPTKKLINNYLKNKFYISNNE